MAENNVKVYCVACGEVSYSDRLSSICFYRFPEDSELKRKWQEATLYDGEAEWATVCSKHFLLSDFECLGLSRQIRVGAVPSQHIDPEMPTKIAMYDSELERLHSSLPNQPTNQPRSRSPIYHDHTYACRSRLYRAADVDSYQHGEERACAYGGTNTGTTSTITESMPTGTFSNEFHHVSHLFQLPCIPVSQGVSYGHYVLDIWGNYWGVPTGINYADPSGNNYAGFSGNYYAGLSGNNYAGPSGNNYAGPSGNNYAGPSRHQSASPVFRAPPPTPVGSPTADTLPDQVLSMIKMCLDDSTEKEQELPGPSPTETEDSSSDDSWVLLPEPGEEITEEESPLSDSHDSLSN